jgi:zinc transport system ATP-binding protein
MKENVVAINNLSFSYDGKNDVISNISMSIDSGDYVGIIGPNGGGKSTLLKLVLGIIKTKRGSISIFKDDSCSFQDWSKIGYISQKATNFDANFPISVYEVISMAKHHFFQPFGIERSTDKQIINTALEEVGMLDYKDRLLKDLSGGQQQKVFIARALASEPKIIFLDEPTSGIDTKAQDSFYTLLQKLNKEKGITLVMVSHDIKKIMNETNKVAFLKKDLIFYGDTNKLMTDERVKTILNENLNIVELIGAGHNA